MESLGETSKRMKDADDDPKENRAAKKQRSTGSETVQFLKEKNEKELKMRQSELELQREMQENERKRHDALMQMLIQQQQHQMQQQFQMMITQQANLVLVLYQCIFDSLVLPVTVL